MAYFADGTHCGLAKTNQFVAFAGHRDTPTSIVLNKDCLHIEIETAAGLRIKQAANPAIGACVQMRIPTQEMFTSRTGDDYFIA
jgi:malate synthase